MSFAVCHILINYIFLNYSFYVCIFLVLSVFLILCVLFFVLFCVLFLLMHIVVLFMYRFTDHCHLVETQLQLINIMS
jgi:hypothetical protein